MRIIHEQDGWSQQLAAFTQRPVIVMLFLGFSAGIPILLIFSSLSLWLREAGVERAAVTYFSWAALGYSFKFVWAPLIDQLPLPWLSRVLGRRRAWMLIAQLSIMTAIVLMASVDPRGGDNQLTYMALAAVLLGFSSATQDIVIDAYRIESAPVKLQALMSATYIAGYRIAMLVAGAGSLYLAAWFGSTSAEYSYKAWQLTYFCMALVMLIGVATTLLIREPVPADRVLTHYRRSEYLRFLLLFVVCISSFVGCYIVSGDIALLAKIKLSGLIGNPVFAAFITEGLRLGFALVLVFYLALLLVKLRLVEYATLEQGYIKPLRDFFQRYGYSLAWLLLALIASYRISDIVLGAISNVFYQDLGYSKYEIATVVKSFGLFMTILGGFIGGLLSMRFGVIRVLFVGAVLAAATNLLFMMLATVGYNMTWLYLVISADNLSAGIASAAFVAFLSSLTNISFTAVQYAIFSSLMTLLPKTLGGYSGSMVDSLGYSQFFLLTALCGLPVLVLIRLAALRFEFDKIDASGN